MGSHDIAITTILQQNRPVIEKLDAVFSSLLDTSAQREDLLKKLLDECEKCETEEWIIFIDILTQYYHYISRESVQSIDALHLIDKIAGHIEEIESHRQNIPEDDYKISCLSICIGHLLSDSDKAKSLIYFEKPITFIKNNFDKHISKCVEMSIKMNNYYANIKDKDSLLLAAKEDKNLPRYDCLKAVLVFTLERLLNNNINHDTLDYIDTEYYPLLQTNNPVVCSQLIQLNLSLLNANNKSDLNTKIIHRATDLLKGVDCTHLITADLYSSLCLAVSFLGNGNFSAGARDQVGALINSFLQIQHSPYYYPLRILQTKLTG